MANKINLSGGLNLIRPHGISADKNALFAHAKTYANRTTRENDATLVAADVGTLAMQTNEQSLWILTAAGPPPTWQELPVAYVAPTFSAFAISGQTTPLEVGDEIATSRTFTWTTTSPSNVEANSISLIDVTGGSVVIDSGLADDSSEATAYPAAPIQKTSATSHTFRISATTTRGATITRDYTVAWYWKRYYGTSATTPLNEAQIEALTSSGLSSGFSGTFSFGAGNYKYLSYAAVLGTATSFKDASTMLDVAMEAPYTVSVTNTFGQTTNYNVHRTTNIIGSAIDIIVS